MFILCAQVRSHKDETVMSDVLAIFGGLKSMLDACAEVQKNLVVAVVVTDKADNFILDT
jgi:hypothetical protein